MLAHAVDLLVDGGNRDDRPMPRRPGASWPCTTASSRCCCPTPGTGSAMLLAWLGFQALATTSSGFAATLGRLDGSGSVIREEAIGHAAGIAQATDLPVSADLENGFADEPAGVAETVRLALEAGLAGCSVEDFTGRQDDPIYDAGLAGRGSRPPPRPPTAVPCTWSSPPEPRTTCTTGRTWPAPSPGCRPTRGTRRRLAAAAPAAARPTRPRRSAGLVAGQPGLAQRARQAGACLTGLLLEVVVDAVAPVKACRAGPVGRASGPTSSIWTRATTTRTAGGRCAGAGSPRRSPGVASSHGIGWAAIGTWWSGRWRGWSATGGCKSALSGGPTSCWDCSSWPAR